MYKLIIDLTQSLKVNIPFIDIHAHHIQNSEGILTVQSHFLQEIDLCNTVKYPFSAAIHPWHAAEFASEQVRPWLENLVKRPGLIAIGETGLDKVCTADYHQQELLLELHLEFAEKYRKPLIIHAVKSWNVLMRYLKPLNVPFILHGYSACPEITKQLIGMGSYFSVGNSVLRTSPRFKAALQMIPLTSLFLETDDSSANIIEIYTEVSNILGLPIEELKSQINQNFRSLFVEHCFVK